MQPRTINLPPKRETRAKIRKLIHALTILAVIFNMTGASFLAANVVQAATEVGGNPLFAWDRTPAPPNWTHGQISGYFEGEDIAFKLELNGLTAGVETSVTLQHDFQRDGVTGIERFEHPDAPVEPGLTFNADRLPFTISSPTLIPGNPSAKSYTFTFTPTGATASLYWDALIAIGAHTYPGASMDVRFNQPGGDKTIPINPRHILFHDLAITKSVDKPDVERDDPASGAQRVRYEIVVTNQGNIASEGTVITDDLTDTFKNAGLFDVDHGGVLNGNVLTWNLGTLAEGASVAVHFRVQVYPTVPDETVIANTAHVANAGDVSRDSNTVQTVVHAPIVQLAKTDNRETADEGDTLTYQITASNTGTGNAYHVAIIDTPPSQITVNPASISDGGVWNGTTITWSAESPNHILAGSFHPLGNWGSSKTLTFSGVVEELPPGTHTLTNTAVLSAQNLQNLEAQDRTTVTVGGPSVGSLRKLFEESQPCTEEGGLRIASKGVGLLTAESGTIANFAVPGEVVKAYLLWSGHDRDAMGGDPDPNVTLRRDGGANVPVVGTPTEDGLEAIAFYADVTSIVAQGTHDYTIAGVDGFDRKRDGAGLLVAYRDPAAQPTHLELWGGLDLAYWRTDGDRTAVYATSFDPAPFSRTATVKLIAGGSDIQNPNRPDNVWFRSGTGAPPANLVGQPGGPLITNAMQDNNGAEWDTITVTVAIPAGATYAAFQWQSPEAGNGESLSWVGMSFSVEKQCECTLTLEKTVREQTAEPGDTLHYRLEYRNSGNANCTGTGVKIEDALDNHLTYVQGSESHSTNPGNDIDFQGLENGILRWNAHVVEPGETGWVSFAARIGELEPCEEIDIPNAASLWSREGGTVWSNTVRTHVAAPCDGSISGHKYHDVNGNGRRDEGEPGLEGWAIFLNGDTEHPARTNADGAYRFGDLAAGDYTVTEESRPDWTMTRGPSNPVRVDRGEDVTGIDFLNTFTPEGSQCTLYGVQDHGNADSQLFKNELATNTPSLVGPVVEDADIEAMDAHPQTGVLYGLSGDDETPLGEKLLVVINRTTGIPDPLTGIPLDIGSGTEYQAASFRPETNELWAAGEDLDLRVVNLTNGTSTVRRSFSGDVEAMAWDLPGDNLYLAKGSNSDLHRYRPSDGTVTELCEDVGGQIEGMEFDDRGNLLVGFHGDATIYTFDPSTCAKVPTYTGYNDMETLSVDCQRPSGDLVIWKFNDLNGNSEWDKDEPPLPNWHFKVAGASEQGGVTDENGRLRFDDLTPGHYVVTETLQPGWTNTTPLEQETDVPPEGQAELTFGNRQIFPDLTVTKTDNLSTAQPGQQITYEMSVQNVGAYRAENVTATDTLPPQATYVSSTVDGVNATPIVTPNPSGDVVVWNLDTMNIVEPTKTKAIQVVIQLDAAFPNGITTITNQVIVATSTEEPNTANNTATDETRVTASPIIAIVKADTPDPVQAGGTLTYTVDWNVSGNAPVTNLVVTDTLPANVNFVSASGSGSYNVATKTITWLLGNHNPGDSGSLTVIVTVATPLTNGTILMNVATIDSAENEPVTDTELTTVASAPLLQVTKTDDIATTVQPGGNITYTIAWSIMGNAPATGVILTDPIPANATFVSASVGSTYNDTTKTVVWSLGNHNPGDSGNVSLTVKVATPLQDATIITNVASLDSTETNPVTDDEKTEVDSAPILTITKTVSASFSNPGASVTYTVTIANTGTDAARNLKLTDTLPVGFLFAETTTNSRTYALGDLAVNGTKTIIYDVTIDNAVPAGRYDNKAIASADNHGAVQAVAPLDIRIPQVLGTSTTGATLTVKKSADVKFTTPGSTVLYTVTIRNVGTETAKNVTLTDTLPLGFTFTDGGKSTKTWAIGDLEPNRERTINAEVTVALDVLPGTYTNIALADADNTTPVSADVDLEVRQGEVLAATGFGARDLLILFSAALLVASGLFTVISERRQSEPNSDQLVDRSRVL